MDTKVTLPKTMVKEIIPFVDSLGFKDSNEFVKQAVEEKILRLNARIFRERSSAIKENLEKKGFSEEDIMKEFEGFRDENYTRG